ncbi:MAG TPA: prepilin-type N-terminal cleavage/methylation domain-containing protein [Blastocatellia bacterium]|nr:prepilin-type N-terminal cleavage/methylation domain-containing protein [Blastocatellia bacterium]
MRHQREAGFTLLEALIAALILLVAIVFVAQLFVTAMQQNRTSRESTHATAIAQSKLEEINAMPLEKLVYGGDLGEKQGAGDKPGTPGYFDFLVVDDVDSDKIGVVNDRSKANYARFWKIEPDPGGWEGMYRITVRVVSLQPGTTTSREEVTLSTIRAQF